MDVQDFFLAEEWFRTWEDVNRLTARMKTDLDEWKAKPGASEKSVNTRTEILERVKHFVAVTGDLVNKQNEMLKESQHIYYKHKRLLEEHAILKAYAASKGIDLSLLPYMTVRDFNIHL